MRKTILIALIVLLVSSPCFAQEVETDGLFSLHGTLWKVFISEHSVMSEWMGFYEGGVYPVSNNDIDSYGEQTYLYEPLWVSYDGNYVDFGVVSIFWAKIVSVAQEIHYGIMQPIGIGMVFTHWVTTLNIPFPIPNIGLMVKVSDNWTPPDVE